MKKLLAYTQDFRASAPVFKLQLAPSGETIRTNVVDRYRPTPIRGDILSELVCSKFSESFYIMDKAYRVSKEDIARQAMYDIRNKLTSIVEKNLPMRNPRQSKLYRWMYREMPNNVDSFNDGLILIYQYIVKFVDEDTLRVSLDNKKHLDNFLALMDAMRDKYEKER